MLFDTKFFETPKKENCG